MFTFYCMENKIVLQLAQQILCYFSLLSRHQLYCITIESTVVSHIRKNDNYQYQNVLQSSVWRLAVNRGQCQRCDNKWSSVNRLLSVGRRGLALVQGTTHIVAFVGDVTCHWRSTDMNSAWTMTTVCADECRARPDDSHCLECVIRQSAPSWQRFTVTKQNIFIHFRFQHAVGMRYLNFRRSLRLFISFDQRHIVELLCC